MSVDFTKPVATADRAQNLTDTKDNAVALAKMLDDTTPTGVATGMIRWSTTNSKWQKYSGGWSDLAATYSINVSSLGGYAAASYLLKSGGTMTGTLTLAGAPSGANDAATKSYVDTAVSGASYVPVSGGTMTGLLTLSGAPTNANHAATKTYADGKLALTGGTLTGALTLSGAPTVDLHAATKLYVDTATPAASTSVAGKIEIATNAEVQAGTSSSLAVVPSAMKSAQIIPQTSQATTSGTSKDFSSVPSWCNRVTVMFDGVSTAGTSNLLVQVGAGSVTTSGYSASTALVYGLNSCTLGGVVTSGFPIFRNSTAEVVSGAVVLDRITGNVWIAHGTLVRDGEGITTVAGRISLVGALDRVRITSISADTFDAGSVNVSWE